MEPSSTVPSFTAKPIFDPTYLNIEYVFNQVYTHIKFFIDAITNPSTWVTIGVVSSLLSIACIAIILYSLVRMREIQNHEKEEIEHEIHAALLHDQAADRRENPRWHYVLTLVESPNESDWRVAIIEADSMMEELLHSEGIAGDSVSELLEGAKTNGYSNIQDAWDAHLVRNQIAHQGIDYPLSQVEARRTIKMFQNFFEELKAI